MRGRDQVRLLVQDKDDGGGDAGLGSAKGVFELTRIVLRVSVKSSNLQRWSEEFYRFRRPNSPDQPFRELDERLSVSLYCSNDDHDYVGVWEHLGRVTDTVIDLLGPIDLFQSSTHHANGKKLEKLVSDVEWEVEYDVPIVTKVTKMQHCPSVCAHTHTRLRWLVLERCCS